MYEKGIKYLRLKLSDYYLCVYHLFLICREGSKSHKDFSKISVDSFWVKRYITFEVGM